MHMIVFFETYSETPVRLCDIPSSNHPEACYCNFISHFIYVSQIVKVFTYVTQITLM
jgi:hypothetical protein